MRSIFTLALLGAIAFASTEEDEAEFLEFEALEEEFMALANEDAMQDFADIAPVDDPDSDQLLAASVNDMVEFAMFAARNNKAYTTADEFKARELQWKKSQKKVDALNSKSKHAHFTVNYTADQTDEEFQRMLGLNLDDATNDRRMLLEDDRHRHLQDTDYYVNWIDEGKVSPVKE